jgi:serine/threonine protein kinase
MVAGYRVESTLGQGTMSTVYRAIQVSLERAVALKVLLPELREIDHFRIRFEREARLQAGLENEHVVPIYDAGESEHGPFLVMRLVGGTTLKQLITDRALDPGRSLHILRQVADALQAAHEADLVHRDIKPQNVLIAPRDHAYLADFGLLKASAEATLTTKDQFIGTIDYVAPEQIQGEPPTGRTDCYALAAVLYECLTGQVPFPKPTEAATLHAHMFLPPPCVTEIRVDLPPEIDEVIARGMAKDPAERHATPMELLDDAARALDGAPPEPPPAAPPPTPT